MTLISNTSHIKMDTYHAQLQSAEYASRMMKLGCYLFMAIVGLIGFMNLANTMIINITTKKQEYGVLQAVGMTNKQLNLMLTNTGLDFYGWHHLRRTCCRSAPWLCTVFLCEA